MFSILFTNGSGVKKLRNKNKAGFTLIELLVVIAIIGLLASVVLLALNSARAKSRDAKRIADIRQMASALELYFNDNNAYPTQATVGGGQLAAALFTTAPSNTMVPKFIGLFPTAPTPQDGTCPASGGATPATAGNLYYYDGGQTSGASYTLTFCLGNLTGGYAAGTHILTPAGIQ